MKIDKILPKDLIHICKLNEPMKEHTTIKIGGKTKYFFEPQNINQLRKVLNFCSKNNIKNSIVGNGSNILFSSFGYNGAIINFWFSYKNSVKIIKKTSKMTKFYGFYKKIKYFFCKHNSKIYFFNAGISLSYLSNFCAKNSLSNLEFAVSIPGTLGGGIIMNAGAFNSELSQFLISVAILDKASMKVKFLPNVDCQFSYRKSTRFSDRSL